MLLSVTICLSVDMYICKIPLVSKSMAYFLVQESKRYDTIGVVLILILDMDNLNPIYRFDLYSFCSS